MPAVSIDPDRYPDLESIIYLRILHHRPLSRRLDRCVIQSETKDPFGGNVYYFTMQITFFTRKFCNVQRNLHFDVVHITTKWVFRLTLDCNGVFAIKAYTPLHSSASILNILIWSSN